MARIEKQQVVGPVIVKQVGGDLRLRGRGGGLLVVEADEPQLELLDGGTGYAVRCGSDCRLTVPLEASVVVQQVGGDAKVTDLSGSVEINAVGGDLVLRSVRGAQVGNVGGDLRIKWAEGAVTIKAVGADATIREVGGDLSVRQVGSDLYLRHVEGHCAVEEVGSDIVLSLDFLPGQRYWFNAQGDVIIRVQPDTDARIKVPAGVAVALDIPAEITESDDGAFQTITLGYGSALVEINCKGELRLIGEAEQVVVGLEAQIEEELDARLSMLEEELGRHLEGLDERIQAQAERFASQSERFASKAEQFAQRFAEQAARQAERAAKQAERAADQARRSMERQKIKRKREFGPRWAGAPWGAPPPPPPPPRGPSEPVTEQERLMILRMVQEQRITVEDAERLLAALEGRE